MAQDFLLKNLLEIAEARTAAAAATLGSLNGDLRHHEAKLTVLLQYRDEYHQRLQNAESEGLDGMRLKNFHDFMERLEQAIQEQRALVTQARQRVDGGRSEWHSQQRRFKAFDTLSQRFETVARRRSNSIEQKQQDDHAARAATAKHHYSR